MTLALVVAAASAYFLLTSAQLRRATPSSDDDRLRAQMRGVLGIIGAVVAGLYVVATLIAH